MLLTLIGAGNVASQLGPALLQAGHQISQVFSRNELHAASLAGRVDAQFITKPEDLRPADAMLFMVSDDALSELAETLRFPDSLCIHTSGTATLGVLKKMSKHTAVLYPLQSFSKSDKVNLDQVPFFVEGSTASELRQVHQLARDLSSRVLELGSESRSKLHLAAVFASNFSNHLYTIASEILKQQDLSFSLFDALLETTVRKALSLGPLEAQTGPAQRGDQKTIATHEALLSNRPDLLDIYKQLSDGISNARDENKSKNGV